MDVTSGRAVRGVLVGWLVVCAACGQPAPQPFSAEPFTPVQVEAGLALSATSAFADERGGGVFVDLAGRVVRLRPDVTRAALEPHPQNPVAVGPASGAWPLGSSLALVSTTRGLFVADDGWLIAPPWRDVVGADELVATAVTDDGVAWIATAGAIYRLSGGQLSELTINGEKVTGVTALAGAPTPAGQPALWFAQGTRLTAAVLDAATSLTLRDSGLSAKDLAGGVIGMAGFAASGGSAGSLWLITPHALLRLDRLGPKKLKLADAPKQLIAAGRVGWLQAGDALYRLDADSQTWSVAADLPAVPTLLGADAAGTAWVRMGAKTVALDAQPTVRVSGLFEGARVYEPELIVDVVAPARLAPTAISWSFDSGDEHPVDVSLGRPGTGPQATQMFYSLGGTQAGAVPKALSFTGLDDGPHTLGLSVTAGDGTAMTRQLDFELHASSTAPPSWDKAIRPISEGRCATCHTTGTLPELLTYDEWKANAALIGDVVRMRRMPADGPLDNAGIQTVERWVNAGAPP